MKHVWKFGLVLNGSVEHALPRGARAVHVGEQQGIPCVWFEVDSAQRAEMRTFVIFGTGHAIPDSCEYIGTVQIEQFVWHVYEVKV